MIKKAAIFVALLIGLAGLAGQAQGPEKGVFGEVGLGVGQVQERSGCVALISPGVGYRFNNHFAAGANVEFQAGKDGNPCLNPMISINGEYDFVNIKNFKITAILRGAWGNNILSICDTPPFGYPITPHHYDVWEVGVGVGCSYSFGGNWSVLLRYANLGWYTTDNVWWRDAAGAFSNDHWMADLGLRRLRLGVRYTF